VLWVEFCDLTLFRVLSLSLHIVTLHIFSTLSVFKFVTFITLSSVLVFIFLGIHVFWTADLVLLLKFEPSFRITLDNEKTVIFDTGRGMDGSDGNSISKW
jgi:hypothetical protein